MLIVFQLSGLVWPDFNSYTSFSHSNLYPDHQIFNIITRLSTRKPSPNISKAENLIFSNLLTYAPSAFFSLSATSNSILSDRTVTLESCWLTSCFTHHIQTVGKLHQFFHQNMSSIIILNTTSSLVSSLLISCLNYCNILLTSPLHQLLFPLPTLERLLSAQLPQ